MILYPAIDLYGGQAVRLYKGDYDHMTVYDTDPLRTARAFEAAGATHMHMVDLEGARDGGTPNLETVRRIAEGTGLFIQLGGGIRSMEVVERYLGIGVRRVVLGTAAVADEAFARAAIDRFGPAVALGADAVLIGRPVCTAAIGGGLEGVKQYFEGITQQLVQAMLLTGVECPDSDALAFAKAMTQTPDSVTAVSSFALWLRERADALGLTVSAVIGHDALVSETGAALGQNPVLFFKAVDRVAVAPDFDSFSADVAALESALGGHSDSRIVAIAENYTPEIASYIVK